MCKHCGYRLTTIIGSIIATIGFSSVYFYSAYPFFVVMASGVCGLGCGLAYLPTICIVTEYFNSKRALALGFAVCGSGLGTFLFAPLLNYLTNIYSWRGAMFLEGGLILNGCVCGAVFRPLTRSPVLIHPPITSHKAFNSPSKHLPEEGEGESSKMPGERATMPVTPSLFLRILRPLINAFSLYLLANATFLIFAASNFLTSLGFNAPFLFATDRAIQMRVEESRASFLVAAIGIGNTLGRVAFGALAMTRRIRIRLHLYNGSLVICGLITAISYWAVEYPLILTYYLAFGFFSGSYVTLFSVLLVDLLGVEFLKDSFGLSLLIMGVAVIVGPPIAGTRYSIKSMDNLE
ncbi:Monocarboxylate transporter 12 [Taenia crassiceps]|uniref:Monocarboxylate transporter 12 n=1 Tax=Taenia crassiceps TaxID=6207 RepID=A0ABR4Q2K5_9CEST